MRVSAALLWGLILERTSLMSDLFSRLSCRCKNIDSSEQWYLFISCPFDLSFIAFPSPGNEPRGRRKTISAPNPPNLTFMEAFKKWVKTCLCNLSLIVTFILH